MNTIVYHSKIFIQGPTMNLSVVIILVFLPMILDVVYSDTSTREISSNLYLFTEFEQMKDETNKMKDEMNKMKDEMNKMKDEMNKLKKGVTIENNHLKNYKVKSEHIESAVLSSGQECWIKCTETDGCTSASFQTEGSTCELSRVTYINHEVLERARGWEVFTKHTPVVSLHDKNDSLDFDEAKAYCDSQGLSIATFEDLQSSFKYGYQVCRCGYVENGLAYVVTQEIQSNCFSSSVGVIPCTWQSTWNVYCKPLKSVIRYEISDMSMDLIQAGDHCESKGTSLATMDDMIEAYNTGYEDCRCGWVANGNGYLIMQKPKDECLNGIGIIPCPFNSLWNAWCKV